MNDDNTARADHRINWCKKFGIAICLAGFMIHYGCRSFQPPQDTGVSADLLEQVGKYLSADDQEADRLLSALAGRSVDELEPALRKALEGFFPKSPPTGKLPGQSLQMGSEETNYGLYVPATYKPSRSYPLIICLHGAGFDGDTYLDRWQPRLGEDYILACPTLEDGGWWTREGELLVLAVISKVSKEYHVDPDRIFLTGMSNGGIGTFLIGLNHPDRFAALIPMAGVLPHTLFPLLDNAQHTPFYIIHGSQDQVMPVRFSRDVAAYLKDKSYPVVYREHEHVHPVAGGHFFPKEELPDLVQWLKAQHRQPLPKELTLVRDRDHPGRAYWVRIDEIDPEVGSFWASEYDHSEEERLQAGAYAKMSVQVSGNTFTVTSENVARYSLLLNRELVDFAQPIRVITNGETRFEGRAEPDSRVLLEEMRHRPDMHQSVLGIVEVKVLPTIEFK
jgi:predicted esterase